MMNKNVAKHLFEYEVQGVANEIAHADSLRDELANDPAYKEWVETLDKAFSLVSSFAEKHNIKLL